MTPTAIDVADELLRLGRKAARAHDGIEIVKLCVIAQGWHLANTGRPLFADRIEAWAHGPNIPTLYRALKHHGTGKIPMLEGMPTRLAPDAAAHVRQVYLSYGHLQRGCLQAMTSAADSPWALARAASDEPCEITQDAMRRHYLALRSGRERVAA